MLEAREDFAAAVADNFVEPDTAIDVHEEGSVADARGLGVGDHVRVEQLVPDVDEFGLGAFAIEAEPVEDGGHEFRRGPRAIGHRPFNRSRVDSAPGG